MARKRKKKQARRRDDVLEVRLRTSLTDAGITHDLQEFLLHEFSRELRKDLRHKISAAERSQLANALTALTETYSGGSFAVPVRLKDGRVVLITSNERHEAMPDAAGRPPDSATAAAGVSDNTAPDALRSIPLPPPTRAEFLLSIVLNADDRETIIGDLVEGYHTYAVPRYGEHGARRWYRLQMWRSLLPLFVKRVRALIRWTVLAEFVKRGFSRLS